jgi:hypothetical protein
LTRLRLCVVFINRLDADISDLVIRAVILSVG